MQPMSYAKRKNRRNKPSANANPANPESPWRSLGYDPGNEAAYDPAPAATQRPTVREFCPADYLVYERRGGRPLPKRYPSWMDGRYADAVKG